MNVFIIFVTTERRLKTNWSTLQDCVNCWREIIVNYWIKAFNIGVDCMDQNLNEERNWQFLKILVITSLPFDSFWYDLLFWFLDCFADWKSEIEESRPNYTSLATRRNKQQSIDSETFNLTNIRTIMNPKLSKSSTTSSRQQQQQRSENLFSNNQKFNKLTTTSTTTSKYRNEN